MTEDDIIRELTTATELPRQAIFAAREQREALAPVFLKVIEDFIYADDAGRRQPSPLLFAVFLLAEWGETRACKPLLRLLAQSPEDLEHHFGFDGLSTVAQKLLASVFDGDIGAYYDFALNRQIDDITRWQMFDALATLVFYDRIDREEAHNFMRGCYDRLDPSDDVVWIGWQMSVIQMRFADLFPLVREAYKRGLIPPDFSDWNGIEKDMKKAIDNPRELDPFGVQGYGYLGDTIEELSEWSSFGDESPADIEWQPSAASGLFMPEDEVQAHNPLRGVGRNAPCPCGSGKKYKKCCLQ